MSTLRTSNSPRDKLAGVHRLALHRVSSFAGSCSINRTTIACTRTVMKLSASHVQDGIGVAQAKGSKAGSQTADHQSFSRNTA